MEKTDFKELYEKEVDKKRRERLTFMNMALPVIVFAVLGNITENYIIKSHVVFYVTAGLMMLFGFFYMIYGLLYENNKVNGKLFIIK
jgi:hypothetical protein